ncbi:MAG: response regulator transcription factor, partial [Chloroflexi bacterium]|nr:response regulator transcription factor [Chloroflexota bacterium]
MLKENCRATEQTAAQVFADAPGLWSAIAQDGYTMPVLPTRRKPREEAPTTRHSYASALDYPAVAGQLLTATIRILLVDSSTIVRAGLRALLGQEREMWIVGEAGHRAEALHLAACLQPQVILIDLMLPDLEGVETIRQLHQANSASHIVVLTMASDEQTVHAAIQAGAIGYLLKDVLKPELLLAVRAAARGEPALHQSAQRALMHQATHAPFKDLTERELDVLRLIAQGCRNREIADTLFLTEGTIKGYVSTVLAKLQVVDRTQAALYAVK